MTAFKTLLNDKAIQINTALENAFKPPSNVPKVIVEAMQYSLFAGGKRLRPVLMTETCRMLGGEVEQVMPLALGMEMIHTYSLIHDDLPSMDDDDLRRGKPTNHKVYGEAIAILAGDGLLNYAVETMLAGVENLSDENKTSYIYAMQTIMSASGIRGMVGGQVADLLAENKSITPAEMEKIHHHKTAALLIASVKSGCLMARATHDIKERLTTYGRKIGLAFQIVDDILDVEGTEEALGKPIGSDEKLNKSTFVSVYGLEDAKNMVRLLESETLALLKPFEEKADFLMGLTTFICNAHSVK